MAHFAEIDENNIVVRVLVTDNDMPKEGLTWLQKRLGGTWIKTSYNTFGGTHLQGGTPLRKNFAAIGFTYDSDRDAFIPPKPFDSWALNEETCLWEPPTPKPEGVWFWDEANLAWSETMPE